jgi:hypothetical protein
VAGFATIGWLVDGIVEDSGDVQDIMSASDIILDVLGDLHKTRPLGEHVLGEIIRQ